MVPTPPMSSMGALAFLFLRLRTAFVGQSEREGEGRTYMLFFRFLVFSVQYVRKRVRTFRDSGRQEVPFCFFLCMFVSFNRIRSFKRSNPTNRRRYHSTDMIDVAYQRQQTNADQLTPLEPQSRCGDKPLKLQVVCLQNGTAVLKGLAESMLM